MKLVTTGAAIASAVFALACSGSGSGPGTETKRLGTGYEPPTSPYSPSGGQEQPTPPYEPSSGSPVYPSGGVACSYCGKTYSCTETGGTAQIMATQITLGPASGGSCTTMAAYFSHGDDDGGISSSATFSCTDENLSTDVQTVPWTPTGNGGFSFTSTLSVTDPTGHDPPANFSITLDCSPE